MRCRPQAPDARAEALGSSSLYACLPRHVTLQIWGLTEMQPALSLDGGDCVSQDWIPEERKDKEHASGIPGLRLRLFSRPQANNNTNTISTHSHHLHTIRH